MSRSRSKSPTRRSSQPATFTPSSGASLLYGGLSPSPAPSSQLSPASQDFLNQFFPPQQPVLSSSSQPKTFRASGIVSLSRCQPTNQPAVSVVLSPPCLMSPGLSPGKHQMISQAFDAAKQPATFIPPTPSNSLNFSPKLL